MRRFRTTQNDSLDLLLDTICNAFGGIVLIAILITLLTSDAKQKLQEAATSADRELVERQIASVQSDVKEAEEYLARQGTGVSVDPNLVARLDGAKAALQLAKDKNTEAWSAWEKAAAQASGNDPEADKVLGEKVSVASRLARLRTETEALQDKLDRLKQRLETLKRERSDIVASKAEQLRLPKEGSMSGDPTYFILRHNEIYPVYLASGSRWIKNKACFDWQEESDTLTVSPIPGKGLSPDSFESSVAESIALTKREGSYVALLVAPDSVGAYRGIRKALVSAGVLFGWRVRDQAQYYFGSGGTSPPPL